MWTRLLRFCTRLSACREMPELAASEMMAISWEGKRKSISANIQNGAGFGLEVAFCVCRSEVVTFSPVMKRSFSLTLTWSMVRPCSALVSYRMLPSGHRTTRPLRPVIYTHIHTLLAFNLCVITSHCDLSLTREQASRVSIKTLRTVLFLCNVWMSFYFNIFSFYFNLCFKFCVSMF